MNSNHIDFVTYCIGNLSRRLNMSAGEVYRRLNPTSTLIGRYYFAYHVVAF